MTLPKLAWRTRLIAISLVAVWGILATRLIQIQWLGHADFSRQASRQRTLIEQIPARPGDILDRDGRVVFATTISVKSVYVVPRRIKDPNAVAEPLAQALGLDANRLTEQMNQNGDKYFLWVKRRISDEELSRVRASKLPEGTWGLRDEYRRCYPLGRLAAHVIGLRDIDGHGRSGLERSLDPIIGGRPGHRRLARDALGRVIDVHDDWERSPVRGHSVLSTLDVVIQLHVERALDRLVEQWHPAHAAAIVLDPHNGEILAMASRPTFDPNCPDHVPSDAWTNYAVAAVFEPGSTIKPLIVAWALDHCVIRTDDSFECERGAFRMGPRILHDHHPYGKLSVTDILVKSSNIGMCKIGQKLTNQGLYRALIAFGFGRKTGVQLPSEALGTVHPLAQWNDYSTGSIPMGQEMGTTALQLLVAHSALANGGRLVRPTLVRRNDSDSETDSLWPIHSLLRLNGPHELSWATPKVTSETVSAETAQWVVQVPMTETVQRGTGQRAQLDGYAAFGKTGTAQKSDPATGRYSSSKYVCSFVCGAPAVDPRFLVLVVVDEPASGANHFGGVVAAPAAGEILRQAFKRVHRTPASQVASDRTADPRSARDR